MSRLIPNSTQVPNVFFDELFHYLKPAEIKVLLYVARRTYGFQKERARIGIRQMSDGITNDEGKRLDFGASVTHANAIKAVNSLIGFGLIVRTQEAIKFPESKRRAAEYEIQEDDNKINWPDLMQRLDSKKES